MDGRAAALKSPKGIRRRTNCDRKKFKAPNQKSHTDFRRYQMIYLFKKILPLLTQTKQLIAQLGDEQEHGLVDMWGRP